MTFEYVMLDGVNDSPAQARELIGGFCCVASAKVDMITPIVVAASPMRAP